MRLTSSTTAVQPGWFTTRVLEWARIHGRTGLPWQTDRTPYRVWVAEIMLQQTQVQTVIPYFTQFTTRFPTLEDLANATTNEVLSVWTGLGYYRRARNLHIAAKQIQEQFAGKVPSSLEELVALPGIGRSTAGAILASGFDQPGVILDGNVKRVLARFHALDGDVSGGEPQRKAWEIAESHTPKTDCASYAQAIMDLGAICCRKVEPTCNECPVRQRCRALKQSRVADYPYKQKRVKPREEQLSFLLILDSQARCLLEQQPTEGLWGNLWLPIRIPPSSTVEDVLTELGYAKEPIEQSEPIEPFTHTLSHIKFHVNTTIVKLDSRALTTDTAPTRRWFYREEAQSVGLARLTTNILHRWKSS